AAPTARGRRSPSRASISSSTASGSLKPPRAKNLMPLSGAGLCDAESMTPRSAPSAEVRYATAGVGSTPSRRTSTPDDARPATTAASRNSPEARESRPTTATGRPRRPEPALNSPASPSTLAAATARSMASSAVRSRPATPRTPSVPNRRPNLPLAVLRSLAGLLEAVLLPLHDAGVTGEEAGLLQRRTVDLGVQRGEGAGQAQPDRTGLAGDPTAVNADEDIESPLGTEHGERLVDEVLVDLVREVRLERTAVDGPLPGARLDANPGHGLLAAAGAVRGAGDDRLAHGAVVGGSGLGRVVGRVLLSGVAFRLARDERVDTAGLGHGSPLTLLARRLLGDLGDLVGHRLLRLVRVLGTGVDLQLLRHLPAEGVLRKHAPDRLLHHSVGALLHELFVGDRAETAWVTGVTVRPLLGELVTRQRDLVGVDDDDEVTRVHVRGVDRLVLTAEQDGYLA